MKTARLLPIALLSLPLLAQETATAPAAPPVPVDKARAQRGEAVYERFCLSCHGSFGDGRGYSAPALDPAPRDFTKAMFKWRSTPSGALPRDEDLLRTLRQGVYHSAMPAWEVLGDRNLRDVAEYLKTFSPRWQSEGPPAALAIPAAPADDAASRTKGAELYKQLGCAACHGEKGRGDGPSAPTLIDDWGRKIVPFDFTAGSLKCGDKPEDIYRVFMTGLNGTPMPSFAGTVSPEDTWHLVHYLRTLRSP
jgi:cytochrome c oxidase cbb3-type subunit 2